MKTRKDFIFLISCLAITLICYLPGFQNDWTNWDDQGYVYANDLTQHLSFSNLSKFFTTYQMGNYHPFAMISLALDAKLFGMEAYSFHAHNIILHLLNVALVFIFILQLTGKNIIAATTALFFGIHPSAVESVAWISERKDVLYTFYYLAALNIYLIYLRKNTRKFYLLTILLFLFSLLSKGQAVTFPIALLLIDYYLKQRFEKKVWIEKIPFLVLSLIFGIVAVMAQHDTPAMTMAQYPTLQRPLFASYSLVSYFYKALIPVPMYPFYAYPSHGLPLTTIFYIMPFIAVIIIAAVFYFRKNRTIFFTFSFFFINIALILQLLPVGNAIMANRYTYIAYLGLFFLIATGIQKLIDKNLKIWSYAMVLALTVFFSMKTFADVKIWKNSETLLKEMLRHNSYLSFAWLNLGCYYQQQNKLDTALVYFSKSIALSPSSTDAWRNRALVYNQKHLYDSAIADLNEDLKRDPNDGDAYVLRGQAYYNKNMLDTAIRDLTRAISLRPKNGGGYEYRYRSYMEKGQDSLALNDLLNLLRLAVTDKKQLAVYHGHLGDIYGNLKQFAASDYAYEKALQMDPDNNSVLNNYAFSLSKRDVRLDKAQAMMEKVVKSDSTNPYFIDTYVFILEHQKKYTEANLWLVKAMKNGGDTIPDIKKHYEESQERH